MESLLKALSVMLGVVATLQWPDGLPRRRRKRCMRVVPGGRR